MEEMIEAMIGQDIEDETDVDDIIIEKQTENEIICDSKISLRRLNTIFQTNIPEEEDNLAGFCLSQLGYIPQIGEVFEYDNLTFEILDADKNKISKVKILKGIKKNRSKVIGRDNKICRRFLKDTTVKIKQYNDQNSLFE